MTIAVAGIAASFLPGISLVGHLTGLAIGAIAGALWRPDREPLAPASTTTEKR